MLTKIFLMILTSLPIFLNAKTNDVLFQEQMNAIKSDCSLFSSHRSESLCTQNKIDLTHLTELRVQLALNKLNPYCKNASADPDGDGWGYESNKSCIVMRSKADQGLYKTVTNLRTLKRHGSKINTSVRIGEKALFNSQMRLSSSFCLNNYRSAQEKKTCLITNLDHAMLSETRVFSALNGGKPYCLKHDSDPDGDGYGWENEESCVVINSPADKVDNYNTNREFDMIDVLVACENMRPQRAIRCLVDGIDDIIYNN